jgi:UDP-N-acetyl-D-glucosamine dehydrogenase
VAYKRDVDDVRESPALDVISLLRQKGAAVRYHDPYVPTLRLHDEQYLHSETYDTELLARSDCVVIVTDHKVYNWDEVVACSQVIVDTRHATKHVAGGARRVWL